jgi:hypothetical protein
VAYDWLLIAKSNILQANLTNSLFFMKKTIQFVLFCPVLALCFGLCLTLGACKKSGYTDTSKLEMMHKLYVYQPEKPKKVSDSLAVYIDYSSGMYEAMYTSLQSVVNDVLNAAKSPKTTYFRVGATVPYRIDIEAKENIPSVTTNYVEKKSALDLPIERIISRNEQAVYITDFELVPTGQKIFEGATPSGRVKTWINPDAWAVEYFEKWLAKGNRIDIYASKFMRNGTQPQFLYTLIFTPKDAVNQENDLLKRLQDLDSKLSANLHHFVFQTANHSVVAETKNYDASNGGLHQNLAPLDFALKPAFDFEYYQLGFKDIDKYILGEETEKDKRIIKNLYWQGEEKNMVNFKDLQWKLKVFDMTETFGAYQQMEDQEPPKYDKDPETGDSTLVSGQTMAFKYIEGAERSEVFDLVVNKETKEFGLKIKSDYIKPSKKGELLRVELLLASANFEENADLAKVLQWKDKEGFMVRSLYESMVEAMKRVQKLNTKKLHTYYVQF